MLANVLLLRQNLEFREKLRGPRIAEVGQRLRQLRGTDMTGAPTVVEFQDEVTLVLYFSPSCEFCRLHMPLWKRLVDDLPQRPIRVLNVVRATEDRAEVREYLQRYRIRDIDTIFVPPEQLVAAGFLMTPMTVAVRLGGDIDHVWAGRWKEGSLTQIRDVLISGGKVGDRATPQ